MSFSIVYDKQFLKLSDGRIVPFILSGDNNFFDVKTDRNGRTYQTICKTWFSTRKDPIQPDQLIKEISTFAKESKEKSGYFEPFKIRNINGCFVTVDQYINFFKTGIRKALTFEQLRNEGIGIILKVYDTDYFSPISNTWIYYEKGFLNALADAKKKGLNVSFSISLNTTEGAKNLRKKFSPKKVNTTKKPKEKTHTLRVSTTQGNNFPYFFARVTKNGYKYGFRPNFAGTFADMERKRKGLLKRGIICKTEPLELAWFNYYN